MAYIWINSQMKKNHCNILEQDEIVKEIQWIISFSFEKKMKSFQSNDGKIRCWVCTTMVANHL